MARELPAFEREVTSAPDRDSLLLALRRVSNSLRDGHLAFTPAGSDGTERFATLPVSFASVGDVHHPWYVVTRSDRRSRVSLGDYLLSYDGVPREKLLEHYRFELNAATPAARSSQLTEFLRRRSMLGYPASGLRVPATFRHGAHGIDTELVFDPPVPDSRAPLEPADLRAPCPAPEREYDPAYELVHAEFLASVSAASGIVLDLRRNGGGMAADHFLSWYAPKAHQGLFEWVHVHPELGDRERLRRALRSTAAVDEYLRRARNGDRCTLGNAPLGELTIALCGLRFQENDPWLEGQVLPVGTVVEPSWPFSGDGAKLLQAAGRALEAWSQLPLPAPVRPVPGRSKTKPSLVSTAKDAS